MLIRTYVVGRGITVRLKSRSVVGVVYLGGVARRLRLRPACCQRSHPTSRRRGTNVTALGCEGQLFVSFYVFGSGFNEANEPSSACRFWRHHRVETGAPPQEPARGQSAVAGVGSRAAANDGALPWPVRGSAGTAPEALRRCGRGRRPRRGGGRSVRPSCGRAARSGAAIPAGAPW